MPDDDDEWPLTEHHNGQQIMCTLCKGPFELDNKELLSAHLSTHFQQLHETELCEICQIGFLHDKDLAEHLRCASIRACGLGFPHCVSCTGHHPPVATSDVNKVSLHSDRKSVLFHLRNWEHRQLRLYMNSIAVLVAEDQRSHSGKTFTQRRSCERVL